MTLDTYSKMLVLINFLALLLLKRYLENKWMLVPFIILLLIQWFWLYKFFSPLGFEIPAAISVVTAISLYFPNGYVRVLALSLVFPSMAAAVHDIFQGGSEEGGTA